MTTTTTTKTLGPVTETTITTVLDGGTTVAVRTTTQGGHKVAPDAVTVTLPSGHRSTSTGGNGFVRLAVPGKRAEYRPREVEGGAEMVVQMRAAASACGIEIE